MSQCRPLPSLYIRHFPLGARLGFGPVAPGREIGRQSSANPMAMADGSAPHLGQNVFPCPGIPREGSVRVRGGCDVERLLLGRSRFLIRSRAEWLFGEVRCMIQQEAGYVPGRNVPIEDQAKHARNGGRRRPGPVSHRSRGAVLIPLAV